MSFKRILVIAARLFIQTFSLALGTLLSLNTTMHVLLEHKLGQARLERQPAFIIIVNNINNAILTLFLLLAELLNCLMALNSSSSSTLRRVSVRGFIFMCLLLKGGTTFMVDIELVSSCLGSSAFSEALVDSASVFCKHHQSSNFSTAITNYWSPSLNIM